ncbi:hypothetical protein DM860_002964 [Cuscuta australis]|uniref:Uncharacterized protein n=1 Tax=Cuscuta australis TaxID=267555 RepID=A0A328D4T7_9ASTE|nr:hypothetical protein DM860_002964 [Cuscuta australis]
MGLTLITLPILAFVLILTPTSATRPPPEAEPATPGFGLPDLGPAGDSFGLPSGIVGGYGSGFGGPNGKSGMVNQPLVCQDKGPCFQKQLTCPAKCFQSFANSGKGYGFGGAAGGCTFDCKNNCIASCA